MKKSIAIACTLLLITGMVLAPIPVGAGPVTANSTGNTVEIEIVGNTTIDLCQPSFPVYIVVFGSPEFDVHAINLMMTSFEGAPVKTVLFRDHNRDGIPDILLSCRTGDTNILAGRTKAILEGLTITGEQFEGMTDIRAVDCPGAVYAMTNDHAGNSIVIFNRLADGTLVNNGSIPTGGLGSGMSGPLASQGSLILSPNNKWLLAVNAGSNSITVFKVMNGGLEFSDMVNSRGTFPVSIAIHDDIVYVLNNHSPNIAGFKLTGDGKLLLLPRSLRLLGPGRYGQVGFSQDGKWLVLTNKTANVIVVFNVIDKLPGPRPTVSPSHGNVPFGFIFDREDHLLVAEAGPNAVSSYEIMKDGALKLITPSLSSGQMATSWIAGNERGHVFTASPGSISSYRVNVINGKLTLLNGVAALENITLDLAIASHGKFLYAIDPSITVHIYHILFDGTLVSMGHAGGGLSFFAQGIAAY